ncbi:MAG: DUF3365 domain-containing protein [Rubrivivax sp.]|jgi:hypothetical protein|nr:DUF3365 domain-containing protein [Rubrivivax sp.]
MASRTLLNPRRWLLPALALGLAGCASGPSQDTAWQAEARQVAASVPPRLLTVLQAEIARGGPAGAVEVCRDKAPAMARAASEQSGWAIRRVSLRNRNPKAVPDAWERAALEDFDRRAAAGEPPAQLERVEVVNDGGRRLQRYMRALPTQDLCVQCHGTPDRISPAVAAKLTQIYPQDRAVGYRVGQIRGAITLYRPAP